MELRDLGFDSWFGARAAELGRPDLTPARVTAVDRGGGLVRDADGEVPFEPAGRLLFSAESPADLPTVGDWVLVQHHSGGAAAIVHTLLPRRSVLRRKVAGKDVDLQMIAANIDTAFIVQSCQYDFSLRRFERYLVMANDGGIEPVLVLSKTDLVAGDELERRIESVRRSGIAVGILPLSNATGEGLDGLRRLLVPGRTCCLLGSSGVGKTTMINRLLGDGAYETRPVSGTGEGTHTTARRQLVILGEGAMLIDTPGMRELGMMVSEDAVEESFADIHDLAASCRYADCGHGGEPGCAVVAAVEDGRLGGDRYRSYLKLRKESAYHGLSYVEKRRKDKAFGKMVKSVKKDLGK